VLLKAALSVNASGWNIDLEPQGGPDTGKPGWGCQGGSLPIGTAADAKLFASWLSAVRAVLSPHGIRLTVDVASWSPVLKQYKTLAPAVDRLQTMSTCTLPPSHAPLLSAHVRLLLPAQTTAPAGCSGS